MCNVEFTRQRCCFKFATLLRSAGAFCSSCSGPFKLVSPRFSPSVLAFTGAFFPVLVPDERHIEIETTIKCVVFTRNDVAVLCGAENCLYLGPRGYGIYPKTEEEKAEIVLSDE